MTKRKCSKCGSVYPMTEEFFCRNQSTNTGGDKYFRPECKSCGSKSSKGKNEAVKRAGKPTRPSLGTPCDRCGIIDRKLVFDHCHETLEHRGWLCDNCNRAMGMLGDDINGMLISAIYIAKNMDISIEEVQKKLKQEWKQYA